MICPSVPISASTELTEFLYISCRKNYCTPFRLRPLLAPGGICPLPPTRRHSVTLTLYLYWLIILCFVATRSVNKDESLVIVRRSRTFRRAAPYCAIGLLKRRGILYSVNYILLLLFIITPKQHRNTMLCL